jgi:ribosomal-protein-serine acetyltransferase
MAIELRHWREDDAEALERAVNESAEHLRPWMPWVGEEPAGVEARRAWIAEAAAGDEEAFGIFEDGRVVGGAGLHPRIGEGGLEIGYWVHAAHIRRGVATEAVRQLIERAFADPAIDRVEIHHDIANVASGGVPTKLGFEHVRDRPDEPEAPGERGVERVWRLARK